MLKGLKRGQAAMEFLMTYGWAILVVLVVIGALAYFGVLSPETLLPDRCELQQGVACNDYKLDASADEIYLLLQNGMGEGIILDTVTVTSQDAEVGVTCNNDFGNGEANATQDFGAKWGKYIPNGGTADLTLDTCGLTATLVGTGKQKFDITIGWYASDSTDSFTHTMNGQILGDIEQ